MRDLPIKDKNNFKKEVRSKTKNVNILVGDENLRFRDTQIRDGKIFELAFFHVKPFPLNLN